MPNGWGMDRHCLLTINETTALLIGTILIDAVVVFVAVAVVFVVVVVVEVVLVVGY
jgi:hypothetical protein